MKLFGDIDIKIICCDREWKYRNAFVKHLQTHIRENLRDEKIRSLMS